MKGTDYIDCLNSSQRAQNFVSVLCFISENLYNLIIVKQYTSLKPTVELNVIRS